ncbi:hypothetical protein [Bacteroides eggerthii]|nr:hypothetical protein [Bacteroides eggerthii]
MLTPQKVGAVKGMHQGRTHQYSLFLSVGKTGRLDKGRLYGCAIGQDFQSRSRLHTIFASENDDDFGGKLF